MQHRFIGKEIKVNVEGELRHPVSFRLDGTEYTIREILAAWPDHGFGGAPPSRKRWWLRHHRNYYTVRTPVGEVFEIYYDRGVSLRNAKYRKWYASRQLNSLDDKLHDAVP